LKKDTITGIVAVVIVAGASALGFWSQYESGKAERAEQRDAAAIEVSITETVTELPETGKQTTFPVTTSVSASVSPVTSVTCETSVSYVTTVITTEDTTTNETTAETVTEPPQTDPPQTDAPRQEEQPRHEEPEPEPEPEPEQHAEEPSSQPEPSVPDSASDFQKEVFRLVNERRKELGLALLQSTEQYNNGADVRASEITSKFDHERPDGRPWYTIFSDAGIPAGYMGENIAAGSSTPQDVFDQWCNSPDHYKNMISPDYKYIGIGYCEQPGSEYRYYWVQLFG
jgi:uncharacterized protein YkwD